MKKSLIIPLMLSAGLLTVADAATSFYNIDGISSSTSADDLWPVSNLIQGPGVGFEADEPYAKLLGGEQGNWVTAAPGGFPSDYIAVAGAPILTIDLGVDVLLTEVSVWGYASTNANGVSAFSLRFATDAEGTGGLGTSIDFNPTFNPTNDDTVRQSFGFDEQVEARWVEMTLSDNFFVAPGDGTGGETPGGDRVGLGEVAFAIIPEPSVSMLVGIFALSFAVIRRRR